jgi:hypothetical protein
MESLLSATLTMGWLMYFPIMDADLKQYAPSSSLAEAGSILFIGAINFVSCFLLLSFLEKRSKEFQASILLSSLVFASIPILTTFIYFSILTLLSVLGIAGSSIDAGGALDMETERTWVLKSLQLFVMVIVLYLGLIFFMLSSWFRSVMIAHGLLGIALWKLQAISAPTRE